MHNYLKTKNMDFNPPNIILSRIQRFSSTNHELLEKKNISQ